MIASFLSLFELLFLSALQMQVTTFIHVHIISCTSVITSVLLTAVSITTDSCCTTKINIQNFIFKIENFSSFHFFKQLKKTSNKGSMYYSRALGNFLADFKLQGG